MKEKYKGELDYTKLVMYPYEYSKSTRRKLYEAMQELSIRIECEEYDPPECGHARARVSFSSWIEFPTEKLEMLKLMTGLLAMDPELAFRIDYYTTAHFSLLTAYSEKFHNTIEDAWKFFEKLHNEINQTASIQVKAPSPLKQWLSLSCEEIKMLRVLFDYFSEDPKMSSASPILADDVEAVADTYAWFYGESTETSREILKRLIRKLQTSVSMRIRTNNLKTMRASAETTQKLTHARVIGVGAK